MAESRENNKDINLVQYGSLCHQVMEMERKIDKMESQLEQLVSLANKSQGGLWIGMSILSAISAVIAFALSHFKG